ncbi:Bug family tripartite tricarboxylate transporter substrate binding protein [Roseomonas populi]|uniref:Tripartite tricarboxylate transporter substrate binding protein n=1 Tax=Roseomonas populi TaxID=3121582 RepID=A0ABT1XBS4_9PROT|nr:tripartite tricarboxylate transporter substrate binding protein [Roseomonas pecuniae]MCR0985582.1 tripartite tricarboxylate transporter substrate binding protein [Roseomonas pecuniae]
MWNPGTTPSLRGRRLLLAGAAALLPASRARAQVAVLDRPARIAIGYPAGGSIDIFARLYAERLAGPYAPSVIVDNRPGASARLAVEAVRGAAPDGATILCTPESVLTITPHIYPTTTRYDGLTDFAPVSAIAAAPFAFCVAAGHPARTLAEFAEWAAGQAEVPYSSPAAGSMPQLLAEVFARRRNLRMTHVSYRGTGAALVDLGAGRISALMTTLGDVSGQHRAGAVRILAVTAAERLAKLPEVPSFAELDLPDVTGETWNILMLPAGTPGRVVESLHAAVVRAAADPALGARLDAIDSSARTCTPEELAARLRAEYARWRDIVRAVGAVGE